MRYMTLLAATFLQTLCNRLWGSSSRSTPTKARLEQRLRFHIFYCAAGAGPSRGDDEAGPSSSAGPSRGGAINTTPADDKCASFGIWRPLASVPFSAAPAPMPQLPSAIGTP